MKLYIVGIGPGEATQMTQRAQAALERVDRGVYRLRRSGPPSFP